MKYFELVVPNTTPENFAKDLASDILGLPPAEITLGKEPNLESVEIDSGNTQILPPDKDNPFFRLEIHAFTLRVTPRRKSFPQMRAILGFGRELGAVIRVEMREMTTTRIRVIGTCEDFIAWYIGSWLSHIIDVYEAKFINPVATKPEQVVYPATKKIKTPKWLAKETSEEAKQNAKEIIQLIQNWIPKQRFKSEEAFVAALAEYLVGNGIHAPEQKGASLVDILAHEIAIEAKLHPNRSEYDRLSGQIIRQLEEFGIVVVLIIRPEKGDLLDEYVDRFDERVVFITK
jgi:hypothetical protein